MSDREGAAGEACVTVVVATYNRPEALELALRSLVAQTHPNWKALVVGDHCEAATRLAVEAVGDRRIRYVNLAARCGDQSGPNSIGATLCDTPFLAFLNHDDLLLADHLETCLGRLERTGADLCIADSLRVTRWRQGCEGTEVRYEAALPRPPSPLHSILSATSPEFEPVSAWVMRTDAYRRVGDWRDGADLHRTPLNDWILRAARARLRIAFSEQASVIHVGKPTEDHDGPTYQAAPVFQRIVVADLNARRPAAFRQWVASQIADAAVATPRSSVLSTVLGHCYVACGLDLYGLRCILIGRRKGYWKQQALRGRTGDPSLPRVDRDHLLDAARASLGEIG